MLFIGPSYPYESYESYGLDLWVVRWGPPLVWNSEVISYSAVTHCCALASQWQRAVAAAEYGDGSRVLYNAAINACEMLGTASAWLRNLTQIWCNFMAGFSVVDSHHIDTVPLCQDLLPSSGMLMASKTDLKNSQESQRMGVGLAAFCWLHSQEAVSWHVLTTVARGLGKEKATYWVQDFGDLQRPAHLSILFFSDWWFARTWMKMVERG